MRIDTELLETSWKNLGLVILPGHPQPEATFDFSRALSDLPVQIGSDWARVPRRMPGASLLEAPEAEHPINVQAVVSVELGAKWIGTLHARCPVDRGPLKWRHAEAFIIHGIGVDADVVRDGLGEQIVILTDPHATARNIDLTSTAGGTSVPLATMLLNKTWQGAPDDELQVLGAKVKDYLLRDLLDRSGMGQVARLAARAIRHDLCFDEDPSDVEDMTRGAVEAMGSRLRHVAKLACQATVLAAPLLDPAAAGPSEEELLDAMHISRWLPGRRAQAQLRRLAKQHLAFDRDDPAATERVAQLRRLAYRIGDEWALDPDEGTVRVVDDAEYLRVQLADVVCGWAWRLIAAGGLVALVKRFRLVIYNGVPLSLDRAGELDWRRGDHRRLLHEAASRNWGF